MSARFRAVHYGPDDMFGTRPVIGYLVATRTETEFVRDLPAPASLSPREYEYLVRTASIFMETPRFDQVPIEVGPNFALGRVTTIPVDDQEAGAWVRARVAERHPRKSVEPLVEGGPLAVTFFPWWIAAERYQVGRFTLLPVAITSLGLVAMEGGEPIAVAEELAAGLRTLFETFRVRDRAIERLTLILVDGRMVLDGNDDEGLDTVAAFAERVVTAALAARRFFDDGETYTSTHDLEVVIQRFTVPVTQIARTVLRRDGIAMTIVPISQAAEVLRPEASWRNTGRPVDLPLLTALAGSRSGHSETWQALDRAATEFQQWNRDEGVHAITDQLARAVTTFLTLFEASTTSIEPTLTAALTQAMQHVRRFPATDVWPQRRPGTDGTLGQPLSRVWMAELCRTRGAAVHAFQRSGWRPRWSPHEHLLFAAYLFPLLLKQRLASLDAYSWTPRDTILLETFEVRLAYPADPADSHGRRSTFSRALQRNWPRLDAMIDLLLAGDRASAGLEDFVTRQLDA